MTTYVKVNCHCGLNEFRAGFPTSSLPISNHLCHCNSCRHSTGQMAVYHVTVSELLAAETNDPFDLSDLTPYKTSPNAIRYFCTSCSAHLIFRDIGENPHWCVAAGALEKTEGIVEVGYHIWIEDTLDGGIAEHLRTIKGVELPRHKRGPESEVLPMGWRSPFIPQPKEGPEQHLRAHCHCKNLSFNISRPSQLSRLPHLPYPDLLFPYDISHLAKLSNHEDVKWWLRPLGSDTPTKYLAGHCACSYCRLTSGFEIQSWAYIPTSNILDGSGAAIVLDDGQSPRPKGLKQYISSPGKYREFCSTCGASAFTWQAARPDFAFVSIGLIDQEQDGARAEGWFEWCKERVSYSEEAISPATVEGLVDGLHASTSVE